MDSQWKVLLPAAAIVVIAALFVAYQGQKTTPSTASSVISSPSPVAKSTLSAPQPVDPSTIKPTDDVNVLINDDLGKDDDTAINDEVDAPTPAASDQDAAFGVDPTSQRALDSQE